MKKLLLVFLFGMLITANTVNSEIKTILKQIDKSKGYEEKVQLYLDLGSKYKSVQPDSVISQYEKALIITEKIKKKLRKSMNRRHFFKSSFLFTLVSGSVPSLWKKAYSRQGSDSVVLEGPDETILTNLIR